MRELADNIIPLFRRVGQHCQLPNCVDALLIFVLAALIELQIIVHVEAGQLLQSLRIAADGALSRLRLLLRALRLRLLALDLIGRLRVILRQSVDDAGIVRVGDQTAVSVVNRSLAALLLTSLHTLLKRPADVEALQRVPVNLRHA